MIINCGPYEQYIGWVGVNFPRAMGELCSALSISGWENEKIEDVLRSSRMIEEIEQGYNPALMSSNSMTLAYALEKERYDVPSDIFEHGETDWLTWWCAESAINIARREKISIADVLDLISFKQFRALAVRYHTLPFEAFWEEVYIDRKKDAIS